MKKLTAKIRRMRTTCWNNLTTGEKAAKVIISLVKIVLVAALIAAGIGIIVAVAAGALVALAIGSAIGGGFTNASRAYRAGDQNVKFW